MATALPPTREMIGELIATPSVSCVNPDLDMSNQAVIDKIAGWSESLGFDVEIQAVDERKRYVFSSQDEILATSIQILSIVATSVGQQSPKALEQGMAQARMILAERGLLGGEDIP